MFVLTETAERVSESNSTYLVIALAVILTVELGFFIWVLVKGVKK